MEIERKWLIKDFPSNSYKITTKETILQGYISIDPEVRIRKASFGANNLYFLSIKSTGDLSRMEVEIEISENDYNHLLTLVPYDMITKNYRIYEFAGYKIEMSRVDNNWYYAEVEFKTEEDANNFEFPFPSLVLKEVTYDTAFKMKNYWKSSRIDSPKEYTKGEIKTIIENLIKDPFKYEPSLIGNINTSISTISDEDNPIK